MNVSDDANGETLAGILERLRHLEDEQSILKTMYAYGHSIDYGVEDTFLDCWAPDAVLHWANRDPVQGHDAIATAFRGHTNAPDAYHKHLLIEPQIAISGDRATAESYFVRLDRYGDEASPRVRCFGRYRDVLTRCADGRWRFLERITELESRLSELSEADEVLRNRAGR